MFLKRRADRLKVLVHNGIGIWLAARRLHQSSFACTALEANARMTRAQFDALVLGLPWHRIGEAGIVTLL